MLDIAGIPRCRNRWYTDSQLLTNNLIVCASENNL